MEIGIKGHKEFIIDHLHTAKAMGSGELYIFATPALAAFIENVCMESVSKALEPGEETVGIHLDITHESATPIGMKVIVESELIQIDRRRLIFDVKAYDECGLISHGKHERFIIQNKSFLEKTNAKLKKPHIS